MNHCSGTRYATNDCIVHRRHPQNGSRRAVGQTSGSQTATIDTAPLSLPFSVPLGSNYLPFFSFLRCSSFHIPSYLFPSSSLFLLLFGVLILHSAASHFFLLCFPILFGGAMMHVTWNAFQGSPQKANKIINDRLCTHHTTSPPIF